MESTSSPTTLAERNEHEAVDTPLHILPHASDFTIDGGNFTNVNGGVHVNVHHHPPAADGIQPGATLTQGSEPPEPLYAESEIYTKGLLGFKRGYPLLIPHPRNNLPVEYRRNGVAIGDVGRISPQGDFDFFFNVYLPADHPINVGCVPGDFTPLSVFLERDIFETVFKRGSVASTSVRSRCPDLDATDIEFQFACYGPNGAFLALPCGSTLRTLENVEALRKYAAENAESWYRYANETRGRRLVNGGLYLITGWEKAATGGMATFQSVPAGSSFDIALVPLPVGDSAIRYSFSRGDPARAQTFAPSPPAEDGKPNTTVFLHGLSISLGQRIIQRLLGKRVTFSQIDENSNSNRPEEYIPFSGSQSSIFSFARSFFSGSGSSGGNRATGRTSDTVLSDIAQSPEVLHPSRAINARLVQMFPEASVSITHDDDWADILHENPDALHDSNFVEKLSTCCNIQEDGGMVFLQRKHDSDGPPLVPAELSNVCMLLIVEVADRAAELYKAVTESDFGYNGLSADLMNLQSHLNETREFLVKDGAGLDSWSWNWLKDLTESCLMPLQELKDLYKGCVTDTTQTPDIAPLQHKLVANSASLSAFIQPYIDQKKQLPMDVQAEMLRAASNTDKGTPLDVQEIIGWLKDALSYDRSREGMFFSAAKDPDVEAATLGLSMHFAHNTRDNVSATRSETAPDPGQTPLNIFPNASDVTIDGGNFTNIGGGLHVHNHHSSGDGASTPAQVSISQPSELAYAESEIYSKSLLRFKRGYPLLVTSPRKNLPLAYQRCGVCIGDVGRISSEGDFDFFFNVYLSAHHPINVGSVPSNFSPLRHFLGQDILEMDLKRGSLSSPSVLSRSPDMDADEITFQFTCCGPNGAFLALPHGSNLRILENIEELRKYAAENAESWYRYANETRGRRLVNGGLYLVTGVEKAPNGGMATFQDLSVGSSFDIALIPRSCSEGGVRHAFDIGDPARTRTFATTPPAAVGTPKRLNNTVFLRGLSISLGQGIIQRLLGKRVAFSQIGDNSNSDRPEEYIPFSNSQGSLLSFALNLFYGSGSSGGNQTANTASETTLSDISPSPEVLHPSRVINARLVQMFPEASVIVTHDDDWTDILYENPDIQPESDPDFVAKVLEHCDIREDGGTVFLRHEKHDNLKLEALQTKEVQTKDVFQLSLSPRFAASSSAPYNPSVYQNPPHHRSTGTTGYVCPDCGVHFTTNSHLRRHERTHTGRKTYTCPVQGCGVAVSRQDNLNHHLRTVHNILGATALVKANTSLATHGDAATYGYPVGVSQQAYPHPPQPEYAMESSDSPSYVGGNPFAYPGSNIQPPEGWYWDSKPEPGANPGPQQPY
ncbi:Pleiotropic drug resistance ABC transporter protein [Mycena kentingensis (nom. inval.)]|nr:Pleiotropic drug resistance ABC transporter protein [Mycena kentingensis (nom. inval.)]